MKRLLLVTAVTLSGLASSAFGQSDPDWDNTGNNLLSGTYNFRETLWVTSTGTCPTDGTLPPQPTVLRLTVRYGTINFDGAGNYTVSGTQWNSDTNSSSPYTPSNTYTMSAGGFGFLNRSTGILTRVYGLVSNGIFIGSTVEDTVNSLFVAARQPTTNITTGTFNQNYTVAYMNLATPNLNDIRDATFQLAPNGTGSLGNTQATGYIGGNSAATNQPISGATYSFTSGVGTVNLGSSGTLISGSKQLFVANGGSLIFGGSTTGADMFVGVLTPASSVPSSAFDHVYIQAGMDVDRSRLPSGPIYLNSYFGSVNAVPSLNSLVGHQRVQTSPCLYDFTYSDKYTLSSSGSYDDFLGIRHFFSQDATVQVGFGVGKYLGINVALQAPPLSSSGVYIFPNGVVNAGSYAPFTAAVSPGEILAIFGTNLAPAGCPENGLFPSSLCGVSVTINGRIAPIYLALPGQLDVLVPYEVTSNNIIEVTVNNNGSTSNRVTSFVNTTSPGAFATPVPNGLGYVAGYHTTRADHGIISAADPARPGEYISVYLTGLGPVTPPITTGQEGPLVPLSRTTSDIQAAIALKALAPEDRNFAGIAPILHGTYQLNVRVPSDVTAGDVFLDIKGPDALNSQIKIPVGGTPITSAVEPRSAVTATPTRGRPEQLPQGSTRRGLRSGSGDSSGGQ